MNPVSVKARPELSRGMDCKEVGLSRKRLEARDSTENVQGFRAFRFGV